MPDNPFIEFNSNFNIEEFGIRVPKFPRDKKVSLSVSDEAYAHLQTLASRYSGGSIQVLIEAIGLLELRVSLPTTIIDPESGTTTDQCRQSGYDDGYNGEPNYFLALFGNLKNEFQEAYMLGFIEGNFCRNSR